MKPHVKPRRQLFLTQAVSRVVLGHPEPPGADWRLFLALMAPPLVIPVTGRTNQQLLIKFVASPRANDNEENKSWHGVLSFRPNVLRANAITKNPLTQLTMSGVSLNVPRYKVGLVLVACGKDNKEIRNIIMSAECLLVIGSLLR